MALSSRDLYLIIRAKNEATSALNSIGRDLEKAAASAQLMGLQSQKAHLMSEQAAQRNAKAQAEYALSTLESQKATAQQAATQEQARLKTIEYANSMNTAEKATSQHSLSVLQNRQAVDQNAVSLMQNAKAQNDLNIQTLRAVPGNDEMVRSIRANNQELQQQIITTRNGIVARNDEINAVRQKIAATQEEINNGNQLAQNQRAVILGAQDTARSYDQQITSQRDSIAAMREEIAGRQLQISSVNQEIASTRQANVEREMASQKMRDTGQAMMSAGTAIAVGGAIGVAAIIHLTDTAAAYEKQTAQTMTQTQGLGTNLKELGDIGLDVAKQFGVPFDSIQKSLFDIFSSMNVSVPQAKALLTDFAKAAVAGSTDVTTAGNATIAIMNAYHIPVANVTKVLDEQFATVKLGRVTYEQLASSIGRSIPSAQRAGQQFNVLGGMIALMTRNGATAAQAVTSAGRAMDLFANSKVGDRMQKIGVQTRDAAGNFRPLTQVIPELQKALEDLSPQERAKELDRLFAGSGNNIQARRFVDLVINSKAASDEFVDFSKKIQGSTGDMDKAYGTMSDTVSNKSQLLKNNFQVLEIELGNALLPALTSIVNGLKDVVDWFERLTPGQQKFLAWSILIGSALAIVVGAFIVLGGAMAVLAAGLGVTIGVLALVIGAVIAFAAVWILAYTKVQWFHDAVNWWFSHLWEVIQWFFSGWKDVLAQATNDIKAFGDWFATGWTGIFNSARSEIQGFWSWFTGGWKGIFTDARNEVQGFWSWFSGGWSGTYSSARSETQGFWSWFTGGWVGTLSSARSEIQGFWSWFAGGWSGVFGSARSEVQGFWSWFTSGWSGTLSSARSELQGFWSWFTSGWAGTLSSARSEISSALSGISSAFSAAWNGIRSALSAFFSWFTSGWASTLSSARSEISSMLSAIGSAFSAAWNSIRSALSAFFSWFVGGWSSTLSSARSAVASGASAIASLFSSLVSNIRSIFQSLISSAFGIGSNIVSGITSGVLSAAGNLASAAASVVTNALAAARAAVGIFSPSRDFADKVGRPISQGMAKGVMDSSGTLNSAVTHVTRGALRVASAAQLNSIAQSQSLGRLTQTQSAPPVSSSLAPAGGFANRGGGQVVVNVYTNEIDPRRHAMMLGSELQNQIG